MLVDDPLRLLNEDRVRALLDGAGFADVSEIRLLARGRHVRYAARLGTSLAELRIEVDTLAGSGFEAERAARVALELCDSFPLPAPFRLLPAHVLGFPASIAVLHPGRDGRRLAAEGDGPRADVARSVGRVAAMLADATCPAFGSRGDGGRFVPRCRSFAEEWLALVRELAARARLAGVDLGPVSSALLAGIADRAILLGEVETFAVVHGELMPQSLRFTPAGQLSEVVGWEGAMAADPLVEWGYLVGLPAPTLGWVLEGFGADRAEALLEPEAIGRIEAYHFGRCLQRIHEVGVDRIRFGDATAVRLLDHATALCERALLPDFVRSQLAAAKGDTRPHAIGLELQPQRQRLRQALDVLRPEPPLPARAASPVAMALGAALLAHVVADTGWCDRTLASVAKGRAAAPCWVDDIPDRAAWRAALVDEVLGAGPTPLPIALLWVVLRGIDTVRGAVSSSTLAGTAALVRAMLAHERFRTDRLADPRATLWQSIAALAALVDLFEDPGGRRTTALEATAIDAWDRLFPLEAHTPTQMAVADEDLSRWLAAGSAPELPVLALAIRTIAGRLPLPAAPEALFRAYQ